MILKKKILKKKNILQQVVQINVYIYGEQKLLINKIVIKMLNQLNNLKIIKVKIMDKIMDKNKKNYNLLKMN